MHASIRLINFDNCDLYDMFVSLNDGEPSIKPRENALAEDIPYNLLKYGLLTIAIPAMKKLEYSNQ